MTTLRKDIVGKFWVDVVIALVLSAVFSCAAYQGAKLVSTTIFDTNSFDVWFESDTPRVYSVMTNPDSNYQGRTSVHPLFSMAGYVPTFLTKKILHLEWPTAVRVVISCIAFIWMCVLFSLFRFMGCRRLDAVLFSLLAAVSAASVFWFTVPETFSFGSVSILLALLITVVAQQRLLSPVWYTLVNVVSLAFTITNWMAGILATMVGNPLKRTLRIFMYAFCLVVLLWSVQKHFYPKVEFLMEGPSESRHMFRADSGGPFHIIKSFFYHSLIMPDIREFTDPDRRLMGKLLSIMVTQRSSPGSGSPWGMGAVILWTFSLLLGMWSLFSLREQFKLRVVLGLLFAGQLGMHLVYGNETFLYALHFIVFLIPLAALGTLTKFRPIVLSLALMLIPCVGINNYLQFNKALVFLRSHGTPRQQVRAHMQFRPQDPWPRSVGHVVLGYPGTKEMYKAYHEPGGSFSPSVGSFGVSIWVLDKDGNLVSTSDSVPLNDIQQKFVETDQSVPGIFTATKYYEALWRPVQPGQWSLDLKKIKDDFALMVVVRSVGPAAGTINGLEWKTDQLSVNDRWHLAFTPVPEQVYLGEEIHQGWIKDKRSATAWTGESGWGYAKFPLSEGNSLSLVISDPLFEVDKTLKYPNTGTNLQLSLPDEQFVNSLNAQAAHIMMGTVGRETRPGDPVAYSYTWQRQAAYEVVALANAGQLDMARQLSVYLAENDFFGGMGTEADAPGLAIWALKEVADRLDDPEYDRFIWPHIQRKAQVIEEMMAATETIHKISAGMFLPKFSYEPVHWMSTLARPVEKGLIVGRASLNYPVFYITAVSYSGLIHAADLARRMRDADSAVKWKHQAGELQEAWGKSFIESRDDQSASRTYGSGLWPSGIALPYQDDFRINLEKFWKHRRDDRDSFTYEVGKTNLVAAEGHQWLFLRDLDHTWRTLRWFWRNQSSPGLYTWWEQPEDTYRGWEDVRGWIGPVNVTPNYGTAAEMLLLQLDMLGYLDENGDQPVIIIGAGVPKEWLVQAMAVKGLRLPHRVVDWVWDGKQMKVTITGADAKVSLGPAFAAETLVNVEYRK